MDLSEIINIVREHLEEQFDFSLEEEGLHEESDLWTAGLVDSFGLVDLVVFLETRFKIKFGAQEMENPELASIAGLSKIILEKRA